MASRALFALLVAGALAVSIAAPAEATVSIVATDPATGEVGVAAASCVQFDLARIATVVPGKGVAVSQGQLRVTDPLRMMHTLRSGASAPEALLHVAGSAPGGDPAGQYAVVTTDGAVIRTGPGLPRVAADATATSIAVVGNDLLSRAVVDRAEAAFLRAKGTLADRLIAALTASSAAGGDRRCHSQTATAAFIIVASPDRQPVVPIRGLPGVARRRAAVLKMVGKSVAADELGDLLRDAAALKRPEGEGAPDLYLSLIQPAHGFNAVELLDQAYRQLQASRTPAPSATPASGHGQSQSPVGAMGDGSQSNGVGWAVAWVALGLVALGAWWIPPRRRERKRERSTTKTTTK